MALKIITVPHPALRKKSKPIKKVDKKLLKFIKELTQTLLKSEDPPGVGLSAPQVGKNWQIFITYLRDGTRFNIEKPTGLKVYINPKITKTSKKLTYGPDKDKPIMEGCLSVPRIYGPVKRYQKITLEYLTLDENKQRLVEQKESLSDFPARVIQHELDHLNAILFIDRVKKEKDQLYILKNDELTPLTEVDFHSRT